MLYRYEVRREMGCKSRPITDELELLLLLLFYAYVIIVPTVLKFDYDIGVL